MQMVVDRLLAGRELAYTSVQTMINVPHRRGKVKRVLKNRVYYYEPAAPPPPPSGRP